MVSVDAALNVVYALAVAMLIFVPFYYLARLTQWQLRQQKRWYGCDKRCRYLFCPLVSKVSAAHLPFSKTSVYLSCFGKPSTR